MFDVHIRTCDSAQLLEEQIEVKTIERDHAMKANDTHVLSQVQTSLFSLLRQARDRHRFLRTISSSDTGLRDDCTGKTGAGNSMSWRSQCQRRIVSLPLECAWNPVMWNKQMETGALYSKIVSILLGSVMLQVNMKAQMDSQMNWVLGIAHSRLLRALRHLLAGAVDTQKRC